MAAAPAKNAKNAADAAPAKKSGKLLWIVIGLVMASAGGGGAAFALLKHDKPASEAKPLGPAQYIALEPSFVVNLADTGGSHYLQTDVQLQTRDPETALAIPLHAPIIRNKLLLLFGQQTSAQLDGRGGKEKLQALALAEVKKTLKEQQAAHQVDALLFTSIVIQ